ncbi:hypothetical protein ACQP2E_14525 [Actinoplanes sp. CA-015351]|uniref:NACHT N-terminal helical domain 7-containing protein n=1 Tax=Actinoplanes sp. CA-015351 TaxID=3239897 RepID=UPI003D96D8EE
MDAVRLLGDKDSKVVAALEKIAGGALLAGTPDPSRPAGLVRRCRARSDQRRPPRPGECASAHPAVCYVHKSVWDRSNRMATGSQIIQLAVIFGAPVMTPG